MGQRQKPTYAQDPDQCSLCGDTKDVEPGRYCGFCGARYMNAWIAHGFDPIESAFFSIWVMVGVLVVVFSSFLLGLAIIAPVIVLTLRKKDKLKRTMVWSREFGGENYFR